MQVTITLTTEEYNKAMASGTLQALWAVTVTGKSIQIGAENQPDQDTEAQSQIAKNKEPVNTAGFTKCTLEDVRSKLAQLAQSGKQKQVKELIESFGASKLTEIPEEKFGELLRAAEGIV
ncbi:MAG: hypothetical protein AB7V16_08675 [Vulcanibacillus sp.]